MESGVLIETLWNVNYCGTPAPLTLSGINRNIVECKYNHIDIRKQNICVLIETLWNVNVHERFHGIQYYLY